MDVTHLIRQVILSKCRIRCVLITVTLCFRVKVTRKAQPQPRLISFISILLLFTAVSNIWGRNTLARSHQGLWCQPKGWAVWANMTQVRHINLTSEMNSWRVLFNNSRLACPQILSGKWVPGYTPPIPTTGSQKLLLDKPMKPDPADQWGKGPQEETDLLLLPRRGRGPGTGQHCNHIQL